MSAPELLPVRKAIDHMLRQAEPYPAIVIDRLWNFIQGNEAATAFTVFLFEGAPNHPAPDREQNENQEKKSAREDGLSAIDQELDKPKHERGQEQPIDHRDACRGRATVGPWGVKQRDHKNPTSPIAQQMHRQI